MLAVTVTRIVEPTSAEPRTYVAAVAPGRLAHDDPPPSQRCHWYAYAVGLPLQEPVVVDRVWPLCAVPEIVGAVEAAGADGAGPLALVLPVRAARAFAAFTRPCAAERVPAVGSVVVSSASVT